MELRNSLSPVREKREGGFMGLNLGYCGSVVQNNKVIGMGSKLSLLDIEIPQGPLGSGEIYPKELQKKIHQSGFIVGLETGYDFKVSGKAGAGWELGYFLNGSLSTTGEVHHFQEPITTLTKATVFSETWLLKKN